MERNNKTKAERRELIFKMDYILLMFLTEKNLLEKFIDNCRTADEYFDFNTINILFAFDWFAYNENKIWYYAYEACELYRNKVRARVSKILHKE